MEEIGVVVSQEVGKITWNFEEIKEKLSKELEIFKKTVYTDDTIKSAKTDVATLRKLSKDVEDRRKEIKAKCLEPYDVIEAQAKELVGLIDEPIKAINAQVEDYEKRRKEAVRAKINEYWKQQSEKLPEDIRDKARQKIYDTRWENATATMKSWKEGIESGVESILKDIETIKSFRSDFEDEIMQVYKKDLNLQPAVMRMNDLNQQRERILEQERRKKEEEERKAREEAERKEREEKKAAEEAAEAIKTQEAVKATINEATSAVNQILNQVEEIKTTKTDGDYSAQMQMYQQTAPDQMTRKTVRLEISGTAEQIDKIKKYIVYSGASWKEDR